MYLLTGANGFIGSYLCERMAREGWPVLATGRGTCRLPVEKWPGVQYHELDFTDPYAVHDISAKFRPTAFIHCGAMGKPDECEENQWEAHRINVEGTINLALQAAELNAYFLFLSTDFVFDGKRGMYREDEALQPVNFYGRTKAEAEAAVAELAGPYGIVRTVLVYGAPQSGRTNLLSVVNDKLSGGLPYRVVDDQFRTPTYVEDLVKGMVEMLRQRAQGIYHLSGAEMMSPYDMAVKMARINGLDTSLIQRVPTSELKHPAPRPMRTGLDISKARLSLGFQPCSFEQGIAAMNSLYAGGKSQE